MHDHSLALATATSGMIGGVTRAVTEEMTLSTISLQGFFDVVFYATVSASVGYGVKRLWDSLVARRKAARTAEAADAAPTERVPCVRSTVKPDDWQSEAPLLPKVKSQPEPAKAAVPPAKRRPGRPRKSSATGKPTANPTPKPTPKSTPKNPSQS